MTQDNSSLKRNPYWKWLRSLSHKIVLAKKGKKAYTRKIKHKLQENHMFLLILLPLLFGVVNSDALNKFKEEQDKGAEWHHVGEQDKDVDAESIAINGKIYYKLKWKE